tara:strand:- start:446 stop:622 length:177 start_codon:yes stop_codon:yes gene_type:complete
MLIAKYDPMYYLNISLITKVGLPYNEIFCLEPATAILLSQFKNIMMTIYLSFSAIKNL